MNQSHSKNHCKNHYSAESTSEMHACGQAIAADINLPAVVYLQGDLGAGKTTLVQGIAQHFSYTGIVSSPTYNLIHQYPTQKAAIAHLDLYRLDDSQELEMLGLADLLSDNSLLLIEWAENGEGYIPKADIEVAIAYQTEPKTGRNIQVSHI